MSEPDEVQRSLALREYELHQQAIEKFDGHRLQTRNWAVVVVVGALAIAFGADSSGIALLGVAASGAFAISEALHMALTLSVIERATRLEPLLAPTPPGNSLAEYEFGVSNAYRHRTTLYGAVSLLFSRDRWHISFFYSALAVGAVVSAVIIAKG
jgi:hypothetical protein